MQNEKLNRTILQRTPRRRWGTPDDFEAAAVFLASKGSDFMTGEILRIDGGYTKL
jgi:NAD(P)-dependent dehydrogenase (short-subunit alcohol dehydrogenase family)